MSHPTYYPTHHEKRMMRALALYQHLTRKQAAPAAGYARSAETHGVEGLTSGTRNGLMEMHVLPTGSSRGNRPGLWMLSQRGLDWLRDNGLVPIDDLPAYLANPSEFFRNHIHAINNVLIGLVEWARTSEGVNLLDFQHDHMLKRRPIVARFDGRDHRTSADGLVDLQAFGFHYRLWLELDRGTEDDKQWKRKVACLVHYVKTMPEDEPLTVMVVVNPIPPNNAERRMRQLRAWTESYLTSVELRQWADLFRFRTIGHEEIPYGEFFTQPYWLRPFDDQLYPLIDAPEEVWG